VEQGSFFFAPSLRRLMLGYPAQKPQAIFFLLFFFFFFFLALGGVQKTAIHHGVA
jgi:hypothetical protein